MNDRNSAENIIVLVLFLIVFQPVAFAESQEPHSSVKAVINYSVAPWDGPAYEILIPLRKIPQSSNPYLIIKIWGNPEFRKAEAVYFSKWSDPKEPGEAIFQPTLNNSLPELLAGTVSFNTLKKNRPVSGSFDLSKSDGTRFKGKFEASWGNKSLGPTR